MDGLTQVLARINEIEQRISGAAANAPSADFRQALAQATGLGAADTPSPAFGTASVGSAMAFSSFGIAGGASGQAVVNDAQRYLGVPYAWGGTNPATGLDCSGLVQRVYGDLGITMPRVAADQAQQGTAVASLAQAQPGDLITYGSPADHIGIYVGNGMMIDAPHTGTSVRMDPVGTPTSIRRIVPSASALDMFDPSPIGASAAGAPAAGAATGSGYDAMLSAATAKYGLPQGLLGAVAQVESGMNPSAASPAGAQGLMQLMPSTAAALGVDALDPAQAIDGAARLLAGHLQRFGSVPLALAAYNAGSGAVSKYGGIPPYPETQAYVTKVMSLAGLAPTGSGN